MKPFTTVAVIVFALVALLQVLRLALGWKVTVNGLHIPLWASVIAAVVAAMLAFKVWREGRSMSSLLHPWDTARPAQPHITPRPVAYPFVPHRRATAGCARRSTRVNSNVKPHRLHCLYVSAPPSSPLSSSPSRRVLASHMLSLARRLVAARRAWSSCFGTAVGGMLHVLSRPRVHVVHCSRESSSKS